MTHLFISNLFIKLKNLPQVNQIKGSPVGIDNKRYYFCIGKSVRPAPAELPQDRKVARVGGCSGAILDLPFFMLNPPLSINLLNFAQQLIAGINILGKTTISY